MDDDKRKHLEFIQNIVTRMNTNAFLIKGWTITLVSALFALAAKDGNANFVNIPFMIIPVFCSLDMYYLSQERQYRALYKDVANKTSPTDYSLDASHYKNTWLGSFSSHSIWPLYTVLMIITFIVIHIFTLKCN